MASAHSVNWTDRQLNRGPMGFLMKFIGGPWVFYGLLMKFIGGSNLLVFSSPDNDPF